MGAGLNLADPVSALQIGELVLARNKAISYFGPRHGHYRLDREYKSRLNPTLTAGSSSYLSTGYISSQMDLGLVFSIDLLWYVTTASKSYLLGFGHSSMCGFDIRQETDNTITARVKISTTTTSLSTTSTFPDASLVWLRLVRDRSSLKLLVNGAQEASATDLSSTGSLVAGSTALWVGRAPSYAAGYGYATGVFGGLYIRTVADLEYDYSKAEIPSPRGPEVLGAWTGELIESNALVFDASRFANHFTVNASTGQNAKLNQATLEPVQMIGTWVLRDGRRHNLVMVGGRLHEEVF